MRRLEKYYPKEHYNVVEIADLEEIKGYLESKAVACWAQSKIENTGYFKLVHTSPQSAGSKSLIIVCKNTLIAEVIK